MKKGLVSILIILALVFVALAVYYWLTPAGSLAHFLPGYQAGSDHKHLKHGFAALIVAIGCGIIAWFMTGKKSSEA